MFKFFDRLDNILDGKTKPTAFDIGILVLLVPVIAATFIGLMWLAAYVIDIYK